MNSSNLFYDQQPDNKIELTSDCRWFIGKYGHVIGLGDVEGMLLNNKTELYDSLAKAFEFDSGRVGIRFFDLRKIKPKTTKHNAKRTKTHKHN